MRKDLGYRSILLSCVLWTGVLAASTTRDLKVAPTGGPHPARPVGSTVTSSVSQEPQTVKSSMETAAQAQSASAGCISCHTKTDEASMHPSGTVTLGCATCHGGDANVFVAAGLAADSSEYRAAKRKAHPQPRVSDLWKSAANPERAYTDWLREAQEDIQFVNPGDLRVVDRTCGSWPPPGGGHRRTRI